jgi:dTDP-4-dehydrorhamnose 3,5-epimerase
MIAKLALTKPSLTLVDAEIGCPTYTKDLADAIVTLMNGTYVPGIYHLINEDEGVNWRAFAEEIFSTLGIAPVFTCVSGDAFPRLAKRADDVSMVNTKGPKLPSRRDALARFFRGPLKGGTTITLTGIPGLFTCTPHRFGDPRGWFSEVMNCDFLRSIGMDAPLVQINEGQSVKGIVRGLHFQRPPFAQTKLVSCTAGRLFDVAVDIRKGSSTYGKSFGVELSAENGMGLYISEGFAHGMMALEDGTRIRYHVFGSGYEPSAEGGLRWNDPSLQIAWPCIDMEPVANSRDANWTLFEETSSPF